MRILITGAGGSLGSGLLEALEGDHELVLSEVFPLDTPHEFRRADLRSEVWRSARAGLAPGADAAQMPGERPRANRCPNFPKLKPCGAGSSP